MVFPIGKSNDGLFWTIIRFANSVTVIHFPSFNININVREVWYHFWFKVNVLSIVWDASITTLLLLLYCCSASREVSTAFNLFSSFQHLSHSFSLSSWSHLMTVSFQFIISSLKEPQTISIYGFYLLHNHVDMSTKSK